MFAALYDFTNADTLSSLIHDSEIVHVVIYVMNRNLTTNFPLPPQDFERLLDHDCATAKRPPVVGTASLRSLHLAILEPISVAHMLSTQAPILSVRQPMAHHHMTHTPHILNTAPSSRISRQHHSDGVIEYLPHMHRRWHAAAWLVSLISALMHVCAGKHGHMSYCASLTVLSASKTCSIVA